MFSRGSDTTRESATRAVRSPRASCTKVSLTGARMPPAVATTSSRRSPFMESGTRAPCVTSPPTVAVLLIGRVTFTSTCGWMALPSSAFSTTSCTSAVLRPRTRTRPAYGTEMAPSRPTAWSGIVALLEPVENRSVISGAENSPPAPASHTVTDT